MSRTEPASRPATAVAAFCTAAQLLLCSPAFALNPALDIGQLAHFAWTIRNGFSNGAVYAIAQTPDPDSTLVNLANVSDSLGGKGVLWELFSFNPPTLRLYVELCSSSPFLSEILTSNPGMIGTSGTKTQYEKTEMILIFLLPFRMISQPVKGIANTAPRELANNTNPNVPLSIVNSS